MEYTMDEIKTHLSNHNIRPSLSRIKIYKYLLENKNHPTVDEIYSNLVSELPTLSKTTVYNTLNLFIDKGIVKLITIEEKETRYDADISYHGHFKCKKCNKIYDFKINTDNIKTDGLNDFKIDERNFYYTGICKKCLSNN